jgi:tRNA(fMet)-specific endonuclease VapC
MLARIHEQRHWLATSSIVVAELSYGARTAAMRAEIEKVLLPVEVHPFTARMAFRMSIEIERLKSRNQIIGFRDLAIAAAALTEGLSLATLNRQEFCRVDGLELLDVVSDPQGS